MEFTGLTGGMPPPTPICELINRRDVTRIDVDDRATPLRHLIARLISFAAGRSISWLGGPSLLMGVFIGWLREDRRRSPRPSSRADLAAIR